MVALSVEGFIASLKNAPAVVLTGTFVAPLALIVEVTVGGVVSATGVDVGGGVVVVVEAGGVVVVVVVVVAGFVVVTVVEGGDVVVGFSVVVDVAGVVTDVVAGVVVVITEGVFLAQLSAITSTMTSIKTIEMADQTKVFLFI